MGLLEDVRAGCKTVAQRAIPHLRKRPGVSGYFVVAGALTDHFRAHGRIPPERLAVFNAEDCAALFGQDLTQGAAFDRNDLPRQESHYRCASDCSAPGYSHRCIRGYQHRRRYLPGTSL